MRESENKKKPGRPQTRDYFERLPVSSPEELVKKIFKNAKSPDPSLKKGD